MLYPLSYGGSADSLPDGPHRATYSSPMAAPLETALLPDTAVVEDDDVILGGVSLRAIAEEFATPVFVYDEATLRARAREAREAFDEGVAYASKAFLCGAMARLARDEGLDLDVATGGEMDLALRAGVPASRLVLHGNNKSVDEIEQALRVGVKRIVVDGADEIARLATRVPAGGVDVLVRVTPGVEAHTHEFVRTGQEDTKFGLSIASGDAERALATLAAIPGVRVRGLHCHIGSQIFEFDGYRAALEVVAPLLSSHHLGELCVGGGLGVAYVAGEHAPTITEWATAIRAGARAAGLEPAVRLTAEPGRAIVARAGLTIYRVGARKVTPSRTYLAVDGGMSDNPRPVLYGSGYEVLDLARPRAERPAPRRLVGKHCESGDVIVDEAWLPEETGVGDLVATPVTGAYGYAMASTYNRVPRPPVVFVRDGVARLVVRRETFEDLARLEVEP